jgi:glyceronephosphate O-acyltransferase
LICIYFNFQKFHNRTINLQQLCSGVETLANLFKQLGATVTIRGGNVERKIHETLAVHSNILQFDPTTGLLETVQPLIDLSRLDKKKLKGHNLSSHTMKLSVPVFSLQLYNNPSLYWLGQPAILVLAALTLSEQGKYEFTFGKPKIVFKSSMIHKNEGILFSFFRKSSNKSSRVAKSIQIGVCLLPRP